MNRSLIGMLLGTLLLRAGNESVSTEAMRQIQAGKFDAACQLLQTSLREHASDAQMWNLLGIAEGEAHRIDLSKDAFEHGLKLAPTAVSLNENLGLLLYRQADYGSAKRYLMHAVELGSNNPGVRFSLAASELRTGEPSKGLAQLMGLQQQLGGLPDYWEERGRAESLTDLGAAETSFDRALQLAPASVGALNGAATIAEKQGLDEKALAYLIRARQAAPEDVPTLIHFGAVCIRRDLGTDALSALLEAHRLAPGNNLALYLLARANIIGQHWQQSYDLFADFARRVPNFAPTYFAMGWLDMKLDRVNDARVQLNHALALAPGLTDARYELAQLELEDGHLDRAGKLLSTVLTERPDHAEANAAMGDLLMRRGDLAGAQTHLEKAIQLKPDLAAAHYKLSLLLFREHQAEKAATEKATADRLTDEAKKASKTELHLILPGDANAQQ